MNAWTTFVKAIKAQGFKGDGEDFDAVVKWLKDNGHNTEEVSDGEATYKLADLHAERKGKRLDITAIADQDRDEARIQAAIAKGLDEALSGAGLSRKADAASEAKANGTAAVDIGDQTTKAGDVKVGKDRLADDPMGGFKHAGEFFQQVAMVSTGENAPAGPLTGLAFGKKAAGLATWTKATLSTYGAEQTGIDGGFAVPPEMRDQIMVMVDGEESILARAARMTTASNSVSLPIDETTPWQTSGGILAYWEGEAGTITQSKPNLKQTTVKLNKCTALVPVTDELLEDAPAMASYVPMKAGEKIDFKIGEGIFRGVGVGEPLGFLNSGNTLSVAKETGQDADTIVMTNVIKMAARAYNLRTSVWFVQQDCIPQLMSMNIQSKTDAGTAVAGGGPVWLANNSLEGPYLGTLLGRPVIITQHCETVGDVGDIILANMSRYWAITKTSGLQTATSIHLWFDQGATAFRFVFRMGGTPFRDTTVTPRDGSNTLADFITLAART